MNYSNKHVCVSSQCGIRLAGVDPTEKLGGNGILAHIDRFTIKEAITNHDYQSSPTSSVSTSEARGPQAHTNFESNGPKLLERRNVDEIKEYRKIF